MWKMSFHEATRHSDFVRKFVLIVWQNVANEAEMMPWKLSDKLHVFLSEFCMIPLMLSLSMSPQNLHMQSCWKIYFLLLVRSVWNGIHEDCSKQSSHRAPSPRNWEHCMSTLLICAFISWRHWAITHFYISHPELCCANAYGDIMQYTPGKSLMLIGSLSGYFMMKLLDCPG